MNTLKNIQESIKINDTSIAPGGIIKKLHDVLESVSKIPTNKDDELKERRSKYCLKTVNISPNDYILKDNFMNINFKWEEIKKWIDPDIVRIDKKGNPGQHQQQGQQKKKIKQEIPLNDVCNHLPKILKYYKNNYPLPSLMSELKSEELKQIRIRFMRLLSFLLLQFKIFS